ncbi:hypothetical protein B0O80DRAFT_456224 [Mortierella sp. GBAus27b]|nr:hypothetical protein B0O80DRAFT_456224 [Mortierella sp. GBAus27b]
MCDHVLVHSSVLVYGCSYSCPWLCSWLRGFQFISMPLFLSLRVLVHVHDFVLVYGCSCSCP